MVHTSQVPNRLRQSPLWLTTTICNGLPVKAGISIFTSYPQEHPSIKDYSKGPDKHGATGTCSVSKVKVSRSAIKNHKQLHRAICFLLEMIPDCPIPVKRGGLGEKRASLDLDTTTRHKNHHPTQILTTDLLHRPGETRPYPSTLKHREEKLTCSFSRGLARQLGYSPVPGAFT